MTHASAFLPLDVSPKIPNPLGEETLLQSKAYWSIVYQQTKERVLHTDSKHHRTHKLSTCPAARGSRAFPAKPYESSEDTNFFQVIQCETNSQWSPWNLSYCLQWKGIRLELHLFYLQVFDLLQKTPAC